MSRKTKAVEQKEQTPVPDRPSDTSFDGFCRWVGQLLIENNDYSYKDEPSDTYHCYSSREKIENEPCLEVRWTTGGVSGGSCWDSSNPRSYVSSEIPEELNSIDIILEKLNPEITFIQYKRLTAGLVKSDSYSQNEYYGNSTNYAVKRVDLKELYEALLEKGLL